MHVFILIIPLCRSITLAAYLYILLYHFLNGPPGSCRSVSESNVDLLAVLSDSVNDLTDGLL